MEVVKFAEIFINYFWLVVIKRLVKYKTAKYIIFI